MASGAQRHGKEPAEEDKFPEGLRVLAVDDDPVCLRVLQILLNICKYKATMVTNARTALNMLREGGEDQFDLVITDVHMPDMDGFKLLEQIGLEMDLPVIMLSVNGEKETIYRGIKHGACDYIVKPPNIKQLRNIWQHVVRKKQVAVNHSSSDDSDDADQRVVQQVISEREHCGAKSKNCSKKNKNDGDNSDENRESMRVQTTRKKPRVSWTGQLHRRFLDVVNQLGVDKAVPKTILQMMNVKNLSRESVASHLQKYRLYLKRVSDEPKKSNYLGGLSQGRKSSCYMDMYQLGGFSKRSTINNLYAHPSVLGPHGLSIEPRNRGMGRSVSPFPRISDHTRLNAFPSSNSDPAYVSVLREKLLEASSVVPTFHPGNSSFAEMPNGGLPDHVNQFPVLPPELISQFSGPMYAAPSAVSTRRDAQFPYHVGSSSNPWQNVASSRSLGPVDGAPFLPSQVNMPQINQLPGFAASPGQMHMFQNEQQNQMEGIFDNNNNNTQVFSFSEQQMTPLFDIASDTAPAEMTQMMVNGGSTSSPLHNLQTGSSVAPPTHMVNGGSISSLLPDLDEIFASMVHQDFNPDDDFFGGEY